MTNSKGQADKSGRLMTTCSGIASLEEPPAVESRWMFVRQACAAWSVPPDVSDMALLVSTELASNAVEHAHTPSHLTLTYTGSVFRVAVRDYCTCPTPIRPRLVNFGTRRCHGLHLVAAVAKTWCVNQHQDGKTIWADLAIDPPT